MNATRHPNPLRGCGRLKQGGVYATGSSFSPTGTLAALTWVLGDHLLASLPARNLAVTVPPRQMVLFDPQMSLDQHTLITADVSLTLRAQNHAVPSVWPALQRLPRLALLDHVGSRYYSPWTFAQELQRLGPSRHIPPMIAKGIAKHLPVPIFFTHSAMPFFHDAAHRDAFVTEILEDDAANAQTQPTWERPRWGLYAQDDHGEGHMLTRVLEHCHTAKDQYDLDHHEAVFCASWITGVVYVLQDDEETLPSHLSGSGIRAVRADQ
jgi:hypothetical protein